MLHADLEADDRQDVEQLRSRYNNPDAIVNQLCEISTSTSTHQFLGKLFFDFTVRMLEQDPPSDAWIQQLKNIRFEIFELYELARAAKS